ncbi:MAG: outer membrane protein assembly factor BamB, partial [Pirellulaceae bacterium]
MHSVSRNFAFNMVVTMLNVTMLNVTMLNVTMLNVTILIAITGSASAADWNQAAGPNGNFVVAGDGPIRFSATHNDNIVWRSSLPNTGQGTAIVSNDRVFVTSHAALEADTEMGSPVVGQCFDASTGKLLWERELRGSRVTDLSSLFSDNTAASPVADGTNVCFINVGGMIKCFDFDGNEKWSHKWVPFGRHHARQHEPILHDGKLIVVQVPRTDLDPKVTTKAGAQPLGRDKQYWTHLLAFDLATGKQSWQAECGTSVHATSLIGPLASNPLASNPLASNPLASNPLASNPTGNGPTAILTGRGGGHKPPEEPFGVTLVDANDGKSIWEIPVNGFPCAQNMAWNSKVACVFAGGKHLTIDVATGKITASVSV